MNTTSSAISLMTERYQKLKEKKQGETPHTSIEVPEEILSLVDNKAYINRYKRLIREGYLRQLLELARIAQECATKQPPSHYFAKACSLTHWDDTLKKMNKVLEATRTVLEVLS